MKQKKPPASQLDFFAFDSDLDDRSNERRKDFGMTGLEPLMQQNFIEYASYVIVDRAIPDVRDGLKPVQRRILNTLFEIDDGRFHKVANVIGETMKLHPHGDASIGDALVVLANKEYFIEKQGNFGNILTGHRAAAPRYIECKLTELAKETLFNKALTDYIPSYDGRKKEPMVLPSKLPVILMLGTEGIAVGMSTRILPHNLPEIWRAQIAVLNHESFELYPDFAQGGEMDISEYEDGLGKVRVRATIEIRDKKKLVITELPYGVTTEGIISSIETASQKGRVKIASIDDFTTENVEIELTLARGVDAEEALPQLFAYTDCEVSINSNILVIDQRQPKELTVTDVVKRLTDDLKALLRAELEHELSLLEDKEHWMTLERIFIENRVYKKIEKAKTETRVRDAVIDGMEAFADQFIREMTNDDVTRLLGLPIRRISLFDINKHKDDFDEVEAAIKAVKSKLRRMTKTTINYIEGLLEKYEDSYPRMTMITSFDVIDKKAVARQNIKLSYDENTQMFGSDVRGNKYQLNVSEYDKVLAICSDGSYRIMQAPSKTYLPGKVLYLDAFDEEEGAAFYVVYRDAKKIAYGKLIHILKFIKDKEYQLIKGEGKVDILFEPTEEHPGELELKFVPQKRQRVKEAEFDLAELDYTSATARGTRLAPKPVSRIKRINKR